MGAGMSPISSRKSVPWSGVGEAAAPIGDGAREGALHMAEELALESALPEWRRN